MLRPIISILCRQRHDIFHPPLAHLDASFGRDVPARLQKLLLRICESTWDEETSPCGDLAGCCVSTCFL